MKIMTSLIKRTSTNTASAGLPPAVTHQGSWIVLIAAFYLSGKIGCSTSTFSRTATIGVSMHEVQLEPLM